MDWLKFDVASGFEFYELLEDAGVEQFIQEYYWIDYRTYACGYCLIDLQKWFRGFQFQHIYTFDPMYQQTIKFCSGDCKLAYIDESILNNQ